MTRKTVACGGSTIVALAVLACPSPALAEDGGDDLFSAFPIPSLPYSDTGDTSDNTNQDDQACPFEGSTSPDVWYQYTSAADASVSVKLCGSAYDTKTYVYDESFALVACNDDGGCGSAEPTMAGLTFSAAAGETYTIVVDGFGGESGAYALLVEEFVPVDITCPTGSDPEGEACGDDTNGGCNMEFPAFTPIACGQTICGTAHYTQDPDPKVPGVRDTDWYEIEIAAGTRLTFTGVAEFSPAVGLVATGGSGNCDDASILAPFATGAPGDEVTIDPCVGPGTHWLFMSVNRDLQSLDVVCGEFDEYYVTLSCEPCTPPAMECPEADNEITHSVTQDIVAGNGIACATPEGLTTRNSFARSFQVGPAGDEETIVLELTIPSTADLGLPGIWPGTNTDGETGDTYIRADDCGITTYQTMTEIGFPTCHWVANLSLNGNLLGGPEGLVATCAEVGLESGTDEPIVATVSVYRDVNGGAPIRPGVDMVLLGTTLLEIGPDTIAQKLAAVFPTPIVIFEPECSPSNGDTDGNGLVDITDLLNVLGDWGCTGAPGSCLGDTNCDGAVNVTDLLDVLANWD